MIWKKENSNRHLANEIIIRANLHATDDEIKMQFFFLRKDMQIFRCTKGKRWRTQANKEHMEKGHCNDPTQVKNKKTL